MVITKRDTILHVTLHPGEYYVSAGEVVISTLLGSCVSACLYDPYRRVVGMNHFLLSSRRYAKQMPLCITDAGRYGIQAMELVINGMLQKGANRAHLKAKAFGGSSLFRAHDDEKNFSCVGEVNTRFIREFLRNDGIPLVAEDLGGDRGRTIRFASADYSVTVAKARRLDGATLLKKERRYWQKTVESSEQTAAEPDLWI